ncbi:hypothetical protein HUA74_43930 [Myxococcus sp. CA051A]|uniref:hypothetical protein n=1 Tax=Myxococcus sp. CA051A TaxID=2741739 RepID=UPI00157B8763|nr:hypothetical protein [Myxococcus sp. CA051A]NTX67619.1 hypothetical protein [Myxococcus sp. CA051A]
MTRALLALVLTLVPWAAHADRGELYTQVALGPSLLGLADPVGGASHDTRPALLADLVVYYGLTHSLYVGGVIHTAMTRDAAFRGVSYRQADGSTPTGTLWVDSWSAGIGPLVAYRYDTGYRLAPIARLELTASYHRQGNQQFAYDGLAGVGVNLQTSSDIALSARLLGMAEYRLSDRFIASLGVAVRRSLGAAAWEIQLPLQVGAIW